MAIWNFNVEFIPRDELFKLCGAIPDSLAFERFDSHQWWHGEDDLAHASSALNEIFGKSELRGKGMLTWHQGPHSLTVYFDENEMVEAIAAEADARQSCGQFLSSLITFARYQRCVLYLSSFEIVLPEDDRLMEAFTRSAARGFLTDPEKVFNDPTRLEFERVSPVRQNDAKRHS